MAPESLTHPPMIEEPPPLYRRPEPAPGRRVGYVVAIAVNIVFLWIVNHLLAWEWPAFLTEDFDEVLPFVQLSIVATIAVNAVWIVHDPAWARDLGNLVTSAIGFVVGVVTWQVFPFDFSIYSTDWTSLARLVIGLAIVGTAIATVVYLVRLVLDTAMRNRSPVS